MSDDFDLESLSKTWRSQPSDHSFDKQQLNKQLRLKRLGLFAMSTLEICILLVTSWLLFNAFHLGWAIHLKFALIFGLVSGFIATWVMIKSRIKSDHMLRIATTDWMSYQEHISLEALKRGKYSNYLIATFGAGLCIAVIYEYVTLNSQPAQLAIRYTLGTVWLLIIWLINHRHMKKHRDYLAALNE